MCFSPGDGTRIASTGQGGRVKVWDAVTGQPIEEAPNTQSWEGAQPGKQAATSAFAVTVDGGGGITVCRAAAGAADPDKDAAELLAFSPAEPVQCKAVAVTNTGAGGQNIAVARATLNARAYEACCAFTKLAYTLFSSMSESCAPSSTMRPLETTAMCSRGLCVRNVRAAVVASFRK